MAARVYAIYGWVAEWLNAAVLKTAEGQPSVGSNPTPSVLLGVFSKCKWLVLLDF